MNRHIAKPTRTVARQLAALGLSLFALQACSQESAAPVVPAETAAAASSQSEVPEAVATAIRAALEGMDEALKVQSIDVSEVPDIYMVQFENGPLVYTTPDGGYFFLGDLYSVQPDGFTNLAEKRRDTERLAKMGALDEKDMIVFPAEGESLATITVFTDINCGYCRKLHQEVPALNAAGVTVRYLAYPRGYSRAGAEGEDYRKLATAWCAEDPLDTMTRLKNGQPIGLAVCDENPVAEQYELGLELGVRGTPAILLEDGRMLPGYQSAPEMLVTLGLEE